MKKRNPIIEYLTRCNIAACIKYLKSPSPYEIIYNQMQDQERLSSKIIFIRHSNLSLTDGEELKSKTMDAKDLEEVVERAKRINGDFKYEQCINPQLHINRGESECNGSCQLYVTEDTEV